MVHEFFRIVLGVLSVLELLCLLRLVLGPRAADRLLAVNMLGGMVISSIAVLSLLLEEESLLDIGLIYALVSFLAVVVLTRIYLGEPEKKRGGEKKENPKEERTDECV